MTHIYWIINQSHANDKLCHFISTIIIIIIIVIIIIIIIIIILLFKANVSKFILFVFTVLLLLKYNTV